VLIIDNYDSFTYNLYQQVAGLGHSVAVAKHDQIDISDILDLAPNHIIISSGPKQPSDSGISKDVIKRFYQTIPILGVCLGHQCIGEVFGSNTIEAPTIVHGKTDQINTADKGLFTSLGGVIEGARYHSLVIDALPDGFDKTAWLDDGTIMAMQYRAYPLYGIQFHPESFMTPDGETIMRNFLSCE